MSDRKKLKQEYKLSQPVMGIYQIRNMVNDKVFISSAKNLTGAINGGRFRLNAGSHLSRTLQADWNKLGEDKFEFEILEEVFPREDPNYDYASDLEALEDLWLEKLEPYGDRGYNERKKTREERLRMIVANRKL